jgi:hypothetical protein
MGGAMRKVVYDGPKTRFDAVIEKYGMLTFEQGVEKEVPDEVAEHLMALNPRGLAVTVDPPYSAPVASDYGMEVFHEVGQSKKAAKPEGGDR